MRVNIYAEELSTNIEIISKEIGGQTFTGLRMYLYLPVTLYETKDGVPDMTKPYQVNGPFMHHPGDDDSSAITIWGKKNLRDILKSALSELDKYYVEREAR